MLTSVFNTSRYLAIHLLHSLRLNCTISGHPWQNLWPFTRATSHDVYLRLHDAADYRRDDLGWSRCSALVSSNNHMPYYTRYFVSSTTF